MLRAVNVTSNKQEIICFQGALWSDTLEWQVKNVSKYFAGQVETRADAVEIKLKMVEMMLKSGDGDVESVGGDYNSRQLPWLMTQLLLPKQTPFKTSLSPASRHLLFAVGQIDSSL